MKGRKMNFINKVIELAIGYFFYDIVYFICDGKIYRDFIVS